MLKVAEVITRMDRGGAPDIVRILCRGIKSDITLITGPTADPSAKTARFFGDFKNNLIVVPELGREIKPLKDLAALFKLYFLFKKHQYDVVHTHTAKAGFLGRIAARAAGVPVIIHTPHGHNFYGYFSSALTRLIIMLERFAGRFSDKIIALSELEKKDILRFGAGKEGQIVVIPTGLEIEEYFKAEGQTKKMIREELGIKNDDPVVLMAGRLEHVKGPEYFIEAARFILDKYEKVNFLIAGDGPLRDRMERRTRDLKMKEKVLFIGWREDMPHIFSITDLLALPSLNEAVGNTLIEAAAAGVPAVASSVGGIPEVVQDKVAGILVKPADPQNLAYAILKLLNDPEKRIKMGEAALKNVSEKYSAKVMVKKVHALYNEACDAK